MILMSLWPKQILRNGHKKFYYRARRKVVKLHVQLPEVAFEKSPPPKNPDDSEKIPNSVVDCTLAYLS